MLAAVGTRLRLDLLAAVGPRLRLALLRRRETDADTKETDAAKRPKTVKAF